MSWKVIRDREGDAALVSDHGQAPFALTKSEHEDGDEYAERASSVQEALDAAAGLNNARMVALMMVARFKTPAECAEIAIEYAKALPEANAEHSAEETHTLLQRFAKMRRS